MTRISKTVIENQFKRLCDALGKRVAVAYNDVGAWRLDNTKCYGGYHIEQIVEHGVSHPFGPERFKAEQFYDMVNFALRAIQIDREPSSHIYWPSDKTATN